MAKMPSARRTALAGFPSAIFANGQAVPYSLYRAFGTSANWRIKRIASKALRCQRASTQQLALSA